MVARHIPSPGTYRQYGKRHGYTTGEVGGEGGTLLFAPGLSALARVTLYLNDRKYICFTRGAMCLVRRSSYLPTRATIEANHILFFQGSSIWGELNAFTTGTPFRGQFYLKLV